VQNAQLLFGFANTTGCLPIDEIFLFPDMDLSGLSLKNPPKRRALNEAKPAPVKDHQGLSK
jgi:hypothetical protein